MRTIKRIKLRRLLKRILIVGLVSSWLLTGWPGTYKLRIMNHELRFPPSVKEVLATSPAVQGTSTCTADTTSTSFTVTLPSSIVAGELLMLFMSLTTTGTVSQSSGGFTQINTAVSGANVQGEVWAKIATGGDANPVFSNSGTSDDVAVVAIRINAHSVSNVSTDIYKGTAATDAGTPTANPDPPPLSPGSTRDWLWLAYHASDDDDDTSVQPSGYNQTYLHCQSANSSTASETSVADLPSTGSTQNPGQFTIAAAEDWVSNTFAVPPLASFSQTAFAFYEDGTEAGSTIIGSQDTNLSRNTDSNSNILLRLRVQETAGGPGASTDDYQLRYSKNSGAYANVTAASSNVLGFNSSNLTDAGATTNRLTGGSGSFVGGVISEDGLADNHQITTLNYTEYLFTLTLVAADLANNDTLDFQLQRNGSDITFSITPRVTATKTTPANFTQNRYQWFVDSDNENVTDAWSSVSGIDLTENTILTPLPVAYDPPSTAQELRLRVNITVGGNTITANTKYFKLQFRTGTDTDCSTGSWTDIDLKTTGSAAWRYADSSVTDDTVLSLAKLTGTDYKETYSNAKPANTPTATTAVGDDIEFDFHIIGANSTSASRYLFRIVETNSGGSSETALLAWTNCPVLHTEPGVDNMMRHGNFFSGEAEQGFWWAD